MERTTIFNQVITRYNDQEGSITKIVKDYPSYSRDKFNKDLKKHGYIKDMERNLYIIKDLEGQIDILDIPGQAPSKEDNKAILSIPKDIKEPTKANTSLESNETTRKKKTFEIDVDLEQLIRVAAALEDITMNDYVNKVLRVSIPVSVKIMVKG